MLNKVVLMGRLTRDPEMRQTQNNTPVANFSLAVDRNYKSGEQKETDFFDIVAWQSTAQFVEKYFRKGQQVVTEGRLQRREWMDKDGQKRIAVEVVAERVYFADSKKADGAEGKDNDSYMQEAYPSTASYAQPQNANPVSNDYPQQGYASYSQAAGNVNAQGNGGYAAAFDPFAA